jgi:hypothetical protein
VSSTAYHEDEDNTFLKNVGTYLSNYSVLPSNTGTHVPNYTASRYFEDGGIMFLRKPQMGALFQERLAD